jgi:hypothetical protein
VLTGTNYEEFVAVREFFPIRTILLNGKFTSPSTEARFALPAYMRIEV